MSVSQAARTAPILLTLDYLIKYIHCASKTQIWTSLLNTNRTDVCSLRPSVPLCLATSLHGRALQGKTAPPAAQHPGDTKLEPLRKIKVKSAGISKVFRFNLQPKIRSLVKWCNSKNTQKGN